MTNERAKRDAMSSTHNPPSSRTTLSGSGPGEPHQCTLEEWREDVDRWRARVDRRLDDGGDEMGALAVSIDGLRDELRQDRRSTRDTSLETLRQVGNLNERVGKMLEVAAFTRGGRDIETSTPGGKIPSITFGKTRVAAPPWLFGALMTLALVLIAGVACVAVIVWLAPDAVHHQAPAQRKP